MRIVSLFTTLLLVTQLDAQEAKFFSALRANNVESISNLLNNRVELCINDSQELYSKKETVIRINAWLKKVSLRSIEPLHGGESKDQKSHYRVAKLNTNSGVYRVFVYVEKLKKASKIKKIQIDSF